MNIHAQIVSLEQIAANIDSALNTHQYAKAKRLVRQLDSFDFELVAQRLRVYATVRLLASEQNSAVARKYLSSQIAYCWTCASTWEFLRNFNSPVTPECTLNYMEVSGGSIKLGVFSAFDANYVACLQVIAPDELSAYRFVAEACAALFHDTCSLVKFQVISAVPVGCTNQGILKTLPFKLLKSESNN